MWTLCQDALSLWKWLEQQNIFLVVQHLVGSLNIRVDKLSRRCLADHEWHLHPEVAQNLFLEWGEPLLDLFATADNAQCHHFCALRVSKTALARRRLSPRVEPGAPVRLSADTTPTPSSQENQNRPGTSYSCCSGLRTGSVIHNFWP